MKILISVINFSFLTGAELYVYELGKALVEEGHEVLVTSRVVGGEIKDRAEQAGIKVFSFQDCPSDWKPDILHVNELWPAAFALSLYPDVPAVASVHSQYAVEEPFISNRIKKYICIRPEVQDVVINKYAIPAARTEVIYNGVDFKRFRASSETPKKRKVLFVGTIDPLRKKAIEHLIQKSQKENFEVLIVGQKHGDYLDSAPSNVTILPPVWNVEKYLSDVTETAGILLGRTTIEGWAAGLPGWIYDVDLRGNIKSVDLHEPPKDVNEKFNITKVVKQIIEEYEGAIKHYRYKEADGISESLRTGAASIGLASAHEYQLHAFNSLMGLHGEDIIRHDSQITELIHQVGHLSQELDQIKNSLVWRTISKLRKISSYLRR